MRNWIGFGNGHGLIEEPSRNLPRELEENHKNRIAGIPAEIQTEHLLDISLECNL
jgi:hypothetical protein